ncbi:MAG: protein kinase [Gemmatimonadota bacterium]|nr:protein kinase [Gemmatimonadota bacterium]
MTESPDPARYGPVPGGFDASNLRERLDMGLEGRYHILAQAGAGGMAIVFRALDLRHDRTVALKVLRPELVPSNGGERFHREIQIAARMSHPHVLPVHDSGEADGLLYYTMPFVEGETLRERLDGTPRLELQEATRIIRDIGQGLAYAHAQGVVHRDLKPGNIMLSAGIAVVADFGIARTFDSLIEETLTQTGVSIGTPSYMSPEQATGETPPDQRSDVYSLGCIFFEMLTGHPPYEAATPVAVMALHLSEPIPDVRDDRPDIRKDIATAIAVAMAKQPGDRFDSATDFIEALETGETPSRLLRARRRRAARRTAGLAATAVVGAAAIFGAFSLLGGGDSTTLTNDGTPMVAVLPFRHLGPPDDSFYAEGITDEISSRIADVQGIGVVASASAARIDLSTTTLEEVGRELGIHYVVRGSIATESRPDGTGRVRVIPELIRISDESSVWSESFNAELTPGEMFNVQSTIARGVAEALNVTLLPASRDLLDSRTTTSLEAYDAFMRGNLYATQALDYPDQLRAVQMYQEAVRIDPGYGLAYARLARSHALFFSLFDRAPARAAAAREASSKADSLIPEHPETQIARAYLSLFVDVDRERALRELDRLRLSNPNDANLHWAAGFVRRVRGDYDGAIERFTDATLLDPHSLLYLLDTAATLWVAGRFEEASRIAEQMRTLEPEWATGQLSQSQLLLYRGDVEAATQVMSAYALREDALEQLVPALMGEVLYRPLWEIVLPAPYQDALRRMELSNTFVDSAAFFYHKARLAERSSEDAEAREHWRSLAQILERRTGTWQATTQSGVDLAFAYAALGRTDEARLIADRLYREDLSEQDGFRGVFSEIDLARLYVRLGDNAGAVRVLEDLAAGPSPASPEFLRVDPAFEPMVGYPRFDALVATGS